MKKLLEKDKKTRKKIQYFEKKRFVLKTIYNNSCLTHLIRLNALNLLNKFPNRSSKTFINNLCVFTINKKKLNKLAHFSRIIFRKLALKEKFSGIHKSSR